MRSHHDDGLSPIFDESVGLCSSIGKPRSRRPLIESALNLHELASQQDERAPQYEGDAIEDEVRARGGYLKQPHLYDGVYVRREISNNQTAHYQVMHLVIPLFAVRRPRQS